MLHTQEHYDLLAQFEREFNVNGSRADKEPKGMWPQGYVYCHGELNQTFLAYRKGYAFGKAIGRVNAEQSACPTCE